MTVSNPIGGGGFSSEVSGPGMTLSGIGTVNLSGTNTYLGETLLQSGIMNLNGSVLGDLNIESRGTLSGNATVHGSLYRSGTVSPGDSIGNVFTTDLYLALPAFITSRSILSVVAIKYRDWICSS